MQPYKTERLTIRPFNDKDTDFVIKLLNQKTFIENIADKGVRTQAQALDYLHTGPTKSYQEYGYGLCMVELNETGKPIGICGILKREQLEHPDIGYAFLPEYCSKGYAFEAATACLEQSFEAHNLVKLLAVTNTDNERSLKLLVKLGFVKIGHTNLYEGEPPVFLLEITKTDSD
jgi:RimJ/RimL family protein N-acetyltransferase